MADVNDVSSKTTDGTNKYVQTPVVAEKVVSTLVSSLTSNRGQRVLSRSTEVSDLLPSATIIHNQPRDIKIENNEMETDVEIENENENETQPFSPEPRLFVASNTLLVRTPSIHPETPQPITTTPKSNKRTNQPDSSSGFPSVVTIHEYIKQKVMEHGISHKLFTIKLIDYMKFLQRMHRNLFEPILCRFGPDTTQKAYVHPCTDLLNDATCEYFSIRQYCLQTNQVYCPVWQKMAKKVSEDVMVRRRTATDSRVPPSTHLTDYEKVEKSTD
jgi:hypothetical protein